MITFWDVAPSVQELEFWWWVEVDRHPLPLAAKTARLSVEQMAETVEAVEEYLQLAAATVRAGVRLRPRGACPSRPEADGPSVETTERLLGWAAWRLLDALCERVKVRLAERDGQEHIAVTRRPRRVTRQMLDTVAFLAALRQERIGLASSAA